MKKNKNNEKIKVLLDLVGAEMTQRILQYLEPQEAE